MNELEQLRERVAALEAEAGELNAAKDAAAERAREAEAALQASYEALAAIGDPLFAATFEAARTPVVADLKRRLGRQRARNRRLETELAELRNRRSVRWATGTRRLIGRTPRQPAPGP